MPSTLFSGSMQATQNVVHIVGTISTSGVYIFQNDMGQMTMGDELELRFNGKVGAGTISCIYLASYAHAQATQIKASPPVVLGQTGHVSITRRASGNAAAWFNYEVLSI